MRTWVLLRVAFDAPKDDWSPWIDVLIGHGSHGVLEEPQTLVAYYPEVPGVDGVLDLAESDMLEMGAIGVKRVSVEEEDWDATFRTHFKPRRIGKRFVVRPTWEAFAAEPDDLELVVDPGQAFGTGDHPTTRMCLELLEDATIAGQTVLDLGCGSGILSIAASKLGAARVLGVDVDPLSVEVAKENATANRAAATFQSGEGFSGIAEAWDVVVSNIISAVLIRLAPEAYRVVAPGGTWIVSGIIHDNWPDVRKAAESVGFTLKTQRGEDDWVAASFARP